MWTAYAAATARLPSAPAPWTTWPSALAGNGFLAVFIRERWKKPGFFGEEDFIPDKPDKINALNAESRQCRICLLQPSSKAE
jgi:hypothetical protein